MQKNTGNILNRLRIRNVTKISLLLVLVMFLYFYTNAMASEDELSGTIQVMMHEGEDVMQPYNDAFMRKYPNVTVEYQSLDDYENTISQKISEDDFGDVIFLPSYMDEYTLVHKFQPLGTYEELSKKYNYIDRGAKIGDYIYSLPSSAYLSGILYNKDLFYRAGISDTPKSIEEFYQDMCLIKESTDAIPFCSYYSTEWALYSWVNFPYIEMTGNPDYRQSDFLYEKEPFSQTGTHYQVYKLLYDLVANDLCEKPLGSIDWNQSLEMLSQGKLGCVVIGSWALHQANQVSADTNSIGFMPFPNSVNGTQYMTVLTDYCIGVNKSSENKEAALKYVEFLLSESGYAIQQDRISVLKSDIFPESYNNLKNIKCIIPGTYSEQNYQYYSQLVQGVNPESTSEIKRIIESAAKMSNENFDDIMQDWNIRWEGARPQYQAQETVQEESQDITATTSDNYAVTFSSTELEYIKNHPVLNIGYVADNAPFQYIDKKGNIQGLSINVLQEIMKAAGIKAQYYEFENTEALINALNSETIDIAAGPEIYPIVWIFRHSENFNL